MKDKPASLPTPTSMTLPEGWEECQDTYGHTYYIDHFNRTTHWEHPCPGSPYPCPSQPTALTDVDTDQYKNIGTSPMYSFCINDSCLLGGGAESLLCHSCFSLLKNKKCLLKMLQNASACN